MPDSDARAALDKAREAWRERDMQLEIDLEPDPEPEDIPIGTCGRCGAYWDMRYYETCPPPCGGYVG